MPSSFAQEDRNVFLIARNTGKKGLDNQDTIRVFGFAENLSQHPSIPGPTIYANEGDSVHIDVWNVSQGAPHTIHLHGLDVDQQNDGVPHLSFTIEHMDHGFYHFKAPHAGTYLYHCHVASSIHVQAGMYGLIIIRPPDGSNKAWNGGPSYANEMAFMLSEIDTVWHHDSVLNHSHGADTTPIRIPNYAPQFFLVNGYSDGQLAEYAIKVNHALNTKTYLRFANIGFYANEIVFPSQLNAMVIASDGRPLPVAEQSDTLLVFPGERYGVLIAGVDTGQHELAIGYRDLNSMKLHSVQKVPVQIRETLAIPRLSDRKLVSIYPNPSNGMINLRSSLGIMKVEMYNLHGTLVFEKQFKEPGSKDCQLDTGPLPKGPYQLRIHMMNDEFASKLVLIQ
jgi:FtsP/CotA-like multicopper oxidase with cupredoxin domain